MANPCKVRDREHLDIKAVTFRGKGAYMHLHTMERFCLSYRHLLVTHMIPRTPAGTKLTVLQNPPGTLPGRHSLKHDQVCTENAEFLLTLMTYTRAGNVKSAFIAFLPLPAIRLLLCDVTSTREEEGLTFRRLSLRNMHIWAGVVFARAQGKCTEASPYTVSLQKINGAVSDQ